MKVFAYMKNDTYRDLCPDYPYEVSCRINGRDYISLVERGNARYQTSAFLLKTDDGVEIKKMFLSEYVPCKTTPRRKK